MIKKIIIVILLISPLYLLTAQDEISEKYEKKIANKQNVFDRIEKYVNENPDVPNVDDLYLQLGRLATELYANEPEKIAFYFNKVIEISPDYVSIDYAKLKYAYYKFKAVQDDINELRSNNLDLAVNWPDNMRLTESKVKSIIEALKDVQLNKESDYYEEAAYRLALVYYNLGLDAAKPIDYFKLASDYLNQLIEESDNQNFVFNSLFLRGIISYNLQNYEKSLDDFLNILSNMDSSDDEKFISYFEQNAIRRIANSLLTFDDFYNTKSQAAEKAIEVIAKITSQNYGENILIKAIDQKKKYQAYMQAVDFYNTLVKVYPDNVKNPAYIDSIVTIYKNNSDRVREGERAQEKIIEKWIRLVKDYNLESAWYNSNKEKEITGYLQIIKDAFEKVEPIYYEETFDNPRHEYYKKYVDLITKYQDFKELTKFDVDNNVENYLKRKAELSYKVASENNSLAYYERAATNFKEFNRKFPSSPFYQEFEQNNYYAIKEMFDYYNLNYGEKTYRDSLIRRSYTRTEIDSLFYKASRRYEKNLENTDNKNELVNLIYDRALVQYEGEMYKKSINDFNKIIALKPESQILKRSYQLVGEMYSNLGQYKESEKFYSLASNLAEGEEKVQMNNNKIAVVQANAEKLFKNNQFESAAQEYLRLAELDTDNKIGYINQAINAYFENNQPQKRVELYIRLAENFDSIEEVLASYKNAWEIAEETGDYAQSNRIKRDFIQKYPNSNEAFKVRVSIIENYKDVAAIQDYGKAAELYLDLYEDRDRIDTGNVTEDKLFLNAISMYEKAGNDTKEVELLLQFEKKYPNHPKAVASLQKAAIYYKENNQNEEFERIAKKLYNKDNTIDWYKDIAKKDLRDILIQADEAFENENRSLVNQLKKTFSDKADYYKNNGVKDLPFEAGLSRFDRFEDYFKFHDNYNEKMNIVYSRYINKTPQQLIWIGRNTTFKKFLFGSGKRVEYVSNRVENDTQELIEIIQKNSEDPDFYKLSKKEQTKALYVAASANEYISEVIEKQIKKYFQVSNEIKKYANKPELLNKVKNIVSKQARTFILKTKKTAYGYYNALYKNYAENSYYKDEWTQKAYAKLLEKGLIEKENSTEIYSDKTWFISNSPNDSLLQKSFTNDSYWTKADEDKKNEIELLGEARTLNLKPSENFVGRAITLEKPVKKVEIVYLAKNALELYWNTDILYFENKVLDSDDLPDGYKLYNTSVVKPFDMGSHRLVFRINNNSHTDFAAIIKLFYADKKENLTVDEEQNDEKDNLNDGETFLTSDFSWYVTEKNINMENFSFNEDTWDLASRGTIKDEFSKLDGSSIPIWTSENNEEIFVYKDFKMSEGLENVRLLVEAPEIKKILLNGKELDIQNNNFVDLENVSLQSGKNTLLLKVSGNNENKFLKIDLKK